MGNIKRVLGIFNRYIFYLFDIRYRIPASFFLCSSYFILRPDVRNRIEFDKCGRNWVRGVASIEAAIWRQIHIILSGKNPLPSFDIHSCSIWNVEFYYHLKQRKTFMAQFEANKSKSIILLLSIPKHSSRIWVCFSLIFFFFPLSFVVVIVFFLLFFLALSLSHFSFIC